MKKKPIEQFDVDTLSPEEESQDNAVGEFTISLNIPENIEIRMVDASQLVDYEIWFSGSGILLSIASAFFTAYIQEGDQRAKSILGYVTVAFFVVFTLFCIVTCSKRRTLRAKGKTVKIFTSRVVTPKEPINQ